MYARAVDEAASRVRELRHETWHKLALGAITLVLAVGASQIQPALAVPLLFGGLAMGALGIRALWRHWDLVDRLAEEREAHVIPEVRAYAAREATSDRRQRFAVLIRSRLTEPGVDFEERVAAATQDLQALASELDDAELTLDPACAVACMRLLTDSAESPLLNPALPAAELRSRVRQIRSGFGPPRLPA